jgi:hypothetical protein
VDKLIGRPSGGERAWFLVEEREPRKFTGPTYQFVRKYLTTIQPGPIFRWGRKDGGFIRFFSFRALADWCTPLFKIM